MDEPTGTISPLQLRTILGKETVKTSRLQRWAEGGIFGNDFKENAGNHGAGKGRRYSFRDAVLAMIVRDILAITRSHTLEIALSKDIHGAIKDQFEGTASARMLRILWDGRKQQWRVTRFIGGANPFGEEDPRKEVDSRCVLLIDLPRIISDVQKHFKGSGSAD